MATEIIHIMSSEDACWQAAPLSKEVYDDTLELTGRTRQEIQGFGGCFNELS